MIEIFGIAFLCVLVYSVYKIYEYFVERRKAKEIVYSQLPEFKKENLINIYETNEIKKEFIKQYSAFMLLKNEIQFNKEIIKILTEKINLATQYKFDILEFLTSEKIKQNKRLAILENEIKEFEYKNAFSNMELLKFIKKNISNSIHNEQLTLFLKESTRGFELENGYVLFCENMIIFLDLTGQIDGIYFYNELEIKSEYYLHETKKISYNDEVVSTSWLHARINGERDLRFSTNYKIYKVSRYKIIFDKQPNYIIIFNTTNEKNKFFQVINAVLSDMGNAISSDMNKTTKKEINNEFKSVFQKSSNNDIKVPENINTKLYCDGKIGDGFDKVSNTVVNHDVNKISLFKNSKNIIPNNNSFKYHSAFGLGKVLSLKDNYYEIDFLNVGIKHISSSFLMKDLSISNVKQYVLENYLPTKYVKIGFSVALIDSVNDDAVYLKFSDGSIEMVNCYFSSDFCELQIPFPFISEEEYYEELKKNDNDKNVLASKDKYIGSFVNHNKFKCGIVKDLSEDGWIIKFDDSGIEKIPYGDLNLTIIGESTYKQYLADLINSKFKRGAYVYHEKYGKSIIINVGEKELELKHLNGVATFNRFALAKSNTIRFLDNVIVYASFGDNVYNPQFGFAKVIACDSNVIDLITNKGQMITINSDSDLFLDNNQKLSEIVGKIKENDIVKNNGILYIVDSFDFEEIKLVSLNINIIKKARISDIQIVSKEDLYKKEFETSNDNQKGKIIRAIFNKDYYTLEEIESEIIKIKNELNMHISLSDILYRYHCLNKVEKMETIYINSKFKNLENYIIYKSSDDNIYYYEQDLDFEYYKFLLKRLCSKRVFIKITDEKFFTRRALGEAGITSESLNEFSSDLAVFIEENIFADLKMVRDIMNPNLQKFFFVDEILVDFILSFEIFKKYKFTDRVFITNKSNFDKTESFEFFIERLLLKMGRNSIDSYELMYCLNDKYNFEFIYENFERELKKFTRLWFSEEMERLFANKKIYYNEVYGNESES